jgi:branched-chain amino acid transport system substrate-binding protein
MLTGWRFFVAVGAALALGCSQVAAGAEDPYEINVILGLSGPATFLGTAEKNMLDAFQDHVNRQGGIRGRALKFVYGDDQSNPQVAVQLTNAVLLKKVPVVLGSSLASTCNAMASLFKNGPVNYCLSPGIYPDAGGYVLSASVSTRELLVATIRYFRLRGWTNVAVLNTTDASGLDADKEIAQIVTRPENRGVTVVAGEHFSPADTSVAAQVAKIKASGAQALIIWAPGTPLGTALRSMKDSGLDIPAATSSANMNPLQLKQYASSMPKDLYFQGLPFIAGMSENARMKRVLDDFTAEASAHKIDIDAPHGIAWDPALLVVDGLRALGPAATADQLRAWIAGQSAYPGITGMYDFRSGDMHGVGVKDVVIMRWDPDKNAFASVSKLGGMP